MNCVGIHVFKGDSAIITLFVSLWVDTYFVEHGLCPEDPAAGAFSTEDPLKKGSCPAAIRRAYMVYYNCNSICINVSHHTSYCVVVRHRTIGRSVRCAHFCSHLSQIETHTRITRGHIDINGWIHCLRAVAFSASSIGLFGSDSCWIGGDWGDHQ